VRQHQFVLGASTISVTETSYRTAIPIQLLQLHSNETTAGEVATKISAEEGILYLQIVNGENRLVDFTLHNQNFRFDPNRIFSTAGIVATLELHSQYNEPGFQSVASFRDSLLHLMGRQATIIAVHNNTDGNFSLADYQHNNTGLVHQNLTQDADDFFITTDAALFNALKEKDFNVVLEYSDQLKDDGSLSIYCSRHSIPYVNIEAEHGHKEEQEKMLRTLIEILKQK
jgi:hypothetical protein